MSKICLFGKCFNLSLPCCSSKKINELKMWNILEKQMTKKQILSYHAVAVFHTSVIIFNSCEVLL